MTDLLMHFMNTFAAAGPLHVFALLILATLGLVGFALYVLLVSIRGAGRGKR